MKLQMLVPMHTYGVGNAERLAIHAVNVAKHLGADVNAFVLLPEFPIVSNVLGNMLVDMPTMMANAKAESRDQGEALMSALLAEAEPSRTMVRRTNVKCLPALFGNRAAERARYHDLTLVAIGADPATKITAEAVIFGSGRATLLVAEAGEPKPLTHVMIAWDGSRTASRAVNDAKFLLQRAQTVTIVTVTDEKQLPEIRVGDALAEHLSFHGIKASIVQVQSGGLPIGQSLQNQALESGADLLVMGGFGHSRIRDFVLGGATSGILAGPLLPALVSH